MRSKVIQLTKALTMIALLGACANPPLIKRDIPGLSGQARYEIDRIDPLAISPEMSAFVQAHINRPDASGGRAWPLVHAAVDPNILNFEYDPSVTLSAQDAFQARTGNCLTFSNMFIAMARQAGLQAWYREVKTPAKWSSVNDTMLVSMHVNAAVRDRGKEYVIDVSRRKVEHNEQVRRLTDLEAEAQFYNNRGVDALIENDLAAAYSYFSLALATYPDLAYVWSNLGVVFRRNEQVEDARFAYQSALEIDPQHSVSLNNLYVILEEEGDFEAAEKTYARVEHIRRGNPYYLHLLAQIAIDEARYSDAVDLLKKAITLDRREYRFYQTLAQSQLLLGETSEARSSIERARQLAPEELDIDLITLSAENPLPDP
jgi:Flp pilus assembly protein TadD